MRLATLILSLLTMISLAQAHSWYPSGCCGGQDCFELPFESVSELDDGWRLVFNGRLYHVSKAEGQKSQDGHYHVCIYNGQVRCFFFPVSA